MARITVEDCLARIPNLFDLVLTASKRSRRLANGAESMVEWENDKPTVVALREIAAGHVDVDILEENEQQQALDAVFEGNATEEPATADAPPLPPLMAAKIEPPVAKARNDAEVRVAAEPKPEPQPEPQPEPEAAAEPVAQLVAEPVAAPEPEAIVAETLSPEEELAALLGATPDPEPVAAEPEQAVSAEPEQTESASESKAAPAWQPEPQSYADNEADASKDADVDAQSDSSPDKPTE